MGLFTIGSIPALSWVGIHVGKGAFGIMAVNALFGWRRLAAWIRLKKELGEEWFQRKPVFEATRSALIYEDGGDATAVPWSDVTSVTIHRKTPIWRTHGNFVLLAPYWLTIRLRAADEYIERNISTWEVPGGLWTLRRFAATMEKHLKESGQSTTN